MSGANKASQQTKPWELCATHSGLVWILCSQIFKTQHSFFLSHPWQEISPSCFCHLSNCFYIWRVSWYYGTKWNGFFCLLLFAFKDYFVMCVTWFLFSSFQACCSKQRLFFIRSEPWWKAFGSSGHRQVSDRIISKLNDLLNIEKCCHSEDFLAAFCCFSVLLGSHGRAAEPPLGSTERSAFLPGLWGTPKVVTMTQPLAQHEGGFYKIAVAAVSSSSQWWACSVMSVHLTATTCANNN